MVDLGLMVDHQKMETNIAHNFFSSLALRDFNYHIIFTVVDEKKKTERFCLTAILKNKSRGIPITLRHCIPNVIALQIQG